jgi:sugar phosphate permease
MVNKLSKTIVNRFPHPYVSVLMVGLGSLFYIYEFFIRVIPSVITSELMHEFAFSASALGFVSSLFYYAYTAMQIPSGLMCDRFGPKRLLFVGLFSCGLATIVFGQTHAASSIGLARLVSGAASAFAFICPLVLTTNWFPSQYFALITGIIQTLGCLGAIFGGGPLAILVNQYGWRTTLGYAGVVGIILSLIMVVFLKDKPKDPETLAWLKGHHAHTLGDDHRITNEWQRLCKIILKRQNWVVALAGFCCWGPIAVFGELWGVQSITHLYHQTNEAAATHLLWIWVGIAVMSPLVGWWSDAIKSRKIPLITCFSAGCLATFILNIAPNLNPLALDLVLLLLGTSAASQPVTFGLIRDHNPLSVAGTAISFNNMAVIFGGVLLQPLFGWILDYYWLGVETAEHIRIYGATEYHDAMWILPICSLLGLFVSIFLIKETHCKRHH